MRKNYVVLRIAKKIDAKRIEALRGEKQDLETQLERATKPQHVKFVETNANGEQNSRHAMRHWRRPVHRRRREASNGTGVTSAARDAATSPLLDTRQSGKQTWSSTPPRREHLEA